MKKTVRLIDGSYRNKDDGVVIELYGRCDSGGSITLLYDDFDPYFYLVEPPSEEIDRLEEEDEVKEIEDEELWVDGEEKKCKKVTVKFPWKVPGYRKRFKKRCKVLAADIPFIQRFIYDLDLGSTISVEGEEVDPDDYTTDLVMDVDEISQAEPIKPDLRILSFDIENSIEDETIYTICCVVDEGGGEKDERKEICFKGDERDIIEDFRDFVADEDPDVITGYNINGYDIPHLEKRVDALGIDSFGLGRDGTDIKSFGNRMWRVNGRVIADAWWSVRTELDLKRETLNHVAKELLGREKKDVNPKEIEKEWDKDPEKVMDYCLTDSELALDILLEIGSLDKAMDIATVSKLPLDEGMNGRTSTLVDSLLIRKADKEGVGVPLTHHRGSRGKIKGGYVHAIEPGLYHWVSVLDFKSMYPSIIIQNNICFTTISEDGEIESPTGVSFLSQDQREGLLSSLLKDLMEERDEVKQKMKEAEGKEKNYYDGLQKAIKVLMNSFYGVFASSFYRFTDKRIGESITAFARENIKTLIEKLEDEGLKVIYSDTDSVFFKSPEENLEGTIELSERIAEEYSQGDIVLEFEKVLNPFFSHGMKKRYVGKVVWPEEDMLVRGYELRRSDSFQAQNEALKDVFDHILDDDVDGAMEVAKDWVEKTRNGEIEPERLVISRTCKKYSYYKNPDSMPNVQAAQKLEDMGFQFTPGMKVSWVVTNADKSPQIVEPWVPDREFEYEPDWHYYARRIAKTLSRVTEVFGWEKDGLLAGNKQSSLFSDKFGDEGDGKEREGRKKDHTQEPKKTDEDVTLEDFM
ncbi:MAG: DNA-directed DNA polymerase [Thermoplasmatota archaeon]